MPRYLITLTRDGQGQQQLMVGADSECLAPWTVRTLREKFVSVAKELGLDLEESALALHLWNLAGPVLDLNSCVSSVVKSDENLDIFITDAEINKWHAVDIGSHATLCETDDIETPSGSTDSFDFPCVFGVRHIDTYRRPLKNHGDL